MSTTPTSSFGYFAKAFSDFTNFTGRSRRKEYWYFALYNSLLSTAFWVLFAAMEAEPLVLVYSFIAFFPALAVTVRRLHDTGRSGWWVFINALPFVGPVVFLIFLVSDSEVGDNKWGRNPKEEQNL